MKILAIQFRYLGDAVLMTPALRAIRDHFPGVSLHVLVAKEVAPLLEHLPWIDRVWPFPRERGRKTIIKGWRVMRALRREHFDRSVDFAGNDRGAIASILCGAPHRLGRLGPGGSFARRRCYTQTISAAVEPHEAMRNLRVLSAWGIAPGDAPRTEIRADPALAGLAEQILPRAAILCHLSTSQPKKEWPLSHWAELHRQATEAGYEVVFSAGNTPREAGLLEEVKKVAGGARSLPVGLDLATFLSVLQRARLFISSDTGPLHFAAALDVPTIALYGPSQAQAWGPLGPRHRAIQTDDCECQIDTAVCRRATPCLTTISPTTVLNHAADLLDDVGSLASPASTAEVTT